MGGHPPCVRRGRAGSLGAMTPLGLLAFFGMAVVTMDVLGGVIAATFLAKGMRPRRLLAFVGAYALAVVVVTLALKPLLRIVGAWLAPVLGSEAWLGAIQIVVGCALIGFAIYQRRSALRPTPEREQRIESHAGSLAVGGLLLSLTTFADPTFTIAVGMAMQVHDLLVEIVLLTAWNVIYQLPLVSVTIAALLGGHKRALAALGRFFGPRRRPLLLLFAAILAIAGAIVIADGVYALASRHHPWLESLLLMRP